MTTGRVAKNMRVLTATVILLLPGVNCGRSSNTTREHPFTLVDPRVENRVVRVGIQNGPGRWSPAESPCGLLVVYCQKPDFDIRILGSHAKMALGLRDRTWGDEVMCSTMVGEKDNQYVGAWWYVPLKPEEFGESGAPHELTLGLPKYKNTGIILGQGQMTIVIVSGALGHGDFTLLSPLVRLPYGEEEEAEKATG